ncbi:MAG: hypothetical protein WA061_05060 [Microgenomates group bacterium]
MHQKICIDKRIGFLALFVVITIVAVNLLSLLNQQKTSTNSKAAEPVVIACNTKGAVVVKDMNGGLWSWGSLKTGISTCSSQRILSSDPNYSLYLSRASSYPDTASSGEFRFMEQYALRGTVCTRYGIDIDMESNMVGGLYAPFNVSLSPSYLSKVPGVLVGTTSYPKLSVGVFDFRSNCNIAGTNPTCRGRIMTIGTQQWNIGFRLCSPIGTKKGCCSTNIVSKSTPLAQ